MDKTYKFEFELTEEQVKEMEKALQNHQDTYYERDVDQPLVWLCSEKDLIKSGV